MSELDIGHSDLCDACGVQAWAKSFETAGGRYLLFCRHHWLRHQLALDALGWLPVDHTDLLSASMRGR